jgi:hypothetical protein
LPAIGRGAFARNFRGAQNSAPFSGGVDGELIIQKRRVYPPFPNSDMQSDRIEHGVKKMVTNDHIVSPSEMLIETFALIEGFPIKNQNLNSN